MLRILICLFILCPILVANTIPEVPVFTQQLESLRATKTPTHLILSGYLRKSMTIALYPKAMMHFKIEGVFLPHELPLQNGAIDYDSLQDFMTIFRNNPYLKTLIISDPYKQIIVDYLDTLVGGAKEIEVVNFIYKKDGQLIGEIKDGLAFLEGAQKEIEFDCEGKAMVFFGCGGVSSAIALQLAPKLLKIGLVDINPEKRDKLYSVLKNMYPQKSICILDREAGPIDFSDFDIFYNGTGLGKFGQDPFSLKRSPLVEGDVFPETGFAIDANYTPWQTQFLKQFESLQFKTLNGYSHMIASTALHLSFISGMQINYHALKQLLAPQQPTVLH